MPLGQISGIGFVVTMLYVIVGSLILRWLAAINSENAFGKALAFIN